MSKKILSALVQYISTYLSHRGLRLDRVVLFGSYAQKQTRKDSDVDIAIVSEDFSGKDIFARAQMVRGLRTGLTHRFAKPFDILFISKEEWKKKDSLMINYVRQGQEIVI